MRRGAASSLWVSTAGLRNSNGVRCPALMANSRFGRSDLHVEVTNSFIAMGWTTT